jgi:HEAT repeat protein
MAVALAATDRLSVNQRPAMAAFTAAAAGFLVAISAQISPLAPRQAGRLPGGSVLRLTVLAAFAASAMHSAPPPMPFMVMETSSAPVEDVRALMAEATGAPPLVCMLAARSVEGGGWLRGGRAPVHPLEAANDPDAWDGQRTLAPADVAYLLERLATGDGCSREIAIRLLARDGSDATVAGLTRHVQSTEPQLRAVAAFGLGMLARDASVEPLLPLVGDATPAVRANAVWALGRIGDVQALAPVQDALDDADAIVREAAAQALGHFESPASVAALIRHLRTDDAASVRRTCAWALAQLEAAEAIEPLGVALRQDSDAEVREMSAWAIGNIDRADGHPALLEAARRDADVDVRETSVWALGESGDRSHADAIGEILASERATRVRATASWALGVLEPARAPRGLIAALADSDNDVRLKAAWALSEIGDSAALPAIRRALETESVDRTRRALLRGLISSGESEDQLVRMFASPNARDREMVARTLAGRTRIDVWPWPMPRPRPFP